MTSLEFLLSEAYLVVPGLFAQPWCSALPIQSVVPALVTGEAPVLGFERSLILLPVLVNPV